MRKLLAVAAALLATTLTANAQEFFESAGGSWSVLGINDACISINRSVAEFNAAPYNALSFYQPKGTNLPHLQAFFWPGAFKADEPVQIFVTPANGQPVEIPAYAASAFHVVSIDPAPEELLEALTTVPQTEINATGIEETLVFETGPLETVADLMGKCVSQ